MKVKDISTIAVCAALIFAQEYILMGVPNVQFTFALIIIFSVHFNLRKSFLIAFIYVIVDVMLFPSIYAIPLILAISIIPLLVSLLKRFTRNHIAFSFFAFVYAFIFSWIIALFNMILMNYNTSQLVSYLIADLPFEIILAASNLVSMLLIFVPLMKILNLTKPTSYSYGIVSKDKVYTYSLKHSKNTSVQMKGVEG